MNVSATGSSVAVASTASVSVRARSECQGQEAAPARRGEDTLEVSSMASLLSKSSEGGDRISSPPVRTGLVDRVRREIASGTYDTPEKLDIALDRMIDGLM